MSSLDVELLIEEVKKFPEIWDGRSEKYRDNNARNAAWTAICQFFDGDFEVKSGAAKLHFEKLVKSKWRHVRDNFIRSLKNSKTVKKYVFSQQLSFLLGSHAHYTASANKETNEDCDEQPSQTSEEVEGENVRMRAWKRRKLRDFQEETEETAPSYVFVNASASSRNAPRDEPKQRSGNQLFFDSLLPLLDTFTEDEQLHFRIEVMRIIRSIKSAQKKPIKSHQKMSQMYAAQRHSDPLSTLERTPAHITVHVDSSMTVPAESGIAQQSIKREALDPAGTSAESPKPGLVYESSNSSWGEDDEFIEQS